MLGLLPSTLRALSSQPHRRTGDPEKRARIGQLLLRCLHSGIHALACAHSSKSPQGRGARSSAAQPTHRVRARIGPPALRGPLCGGEGRTTRPAGGLTGMSSLFRPDRRGHGCRSGGNAGAVAPVRPKKPAGPHALSGQEARKATTSLTWREARESNSRAGSARKLLKLLISREARRAGTRERAGGQGVPAKAPRSQSCISR